MTRPALLATPVPTTVGVSAPNAERHGWRLVLAVACLLAGLAPAPLRAFDGVSPGDSPLGDVRDAVRDARSFLVSEALVWAPVVGASFELDLPLGIQLRASGLPARAIVPLLELDEVRSDRSPEDRFLGVEGRVALTHTLGRAIEVGVAYSSRGNLSDSVGLDLDRHFVGGVFSIRY